jgi:hypothetical protein
LFEVVEELYALGFGELFISQEDDGEEHIGEGGVDVFPAEFIAELAVGS